MADDSDSSLSDAADALPTDREIEDALRGAVIQAFENCDLDGLTLKGVRANAGNRLNLPDGYFKTNETWNTKSKEIIKDQVAKCEASSSPASQHQSESPKPKDPPFATLAPKRKSPEPQQPATKKQRRTVSASSDIESEQEQAPSLPDSSPPDSPPAPAPSKDSDELGPDSELSDVIDDLPPARRKKRKTSQNPQTSSADTAPNPKKQKQKPSAAAPQQDEVKKLQVQLGKCGIRKVWAKELAGYETTREKVAHLKGLLRGVGMGARFSEERARKIKEARELEADVEAVQEGEQRWGKRDRRPQSKMAKGLEELQGLVGNDEESD